MANRFCVGANWNLAASWSTSSGGAGGAGIPTLADDAFIDVNSPALITISAPITCLSLALTAKVLDQDGYKMTVTNIFTINGGAEFICSSTNKLLVGSFVVDDTNSSITFKNVLNNLLKEDGFALLQESDDKIELEN